MKNQTIVVRQPLKFAYCDESFRRRLTVTLLMVKFIALAFAPVASFADTLPSSPFQQISLQQISPDTNGGYAYRLDYHVPAAIETFWRFKTDFDSEILLTNDELIEHRIVKAFGNSVITENRYATAPGLRFRWQTTVIPDQYRLEFKLLNAKDCRHKFHYGTIQLTPEGEYTKVTQIAYFDFRGAALWVRYPWYGGMKDFLTYTARWEQAIILHLKSRYIQKSAQ